MHEDDSSIDGSLEDFLQREGIKNFDAPARRSQAFDDNLSAVCDHVICATRHLK